MTTPVTNGYQVDPGELTRFAGYLTQTTAPDVDKSAQSVSSLNGFDVNAFGILVAQVFAVPTRIALGVVSAKMNSLSSEITDAARTTTTTATRYQDNEANQAQAFQSIPVGGQ